MIRLAVSLYDKGSVITTIGLCKCYSCIHYLQHVRRRQSYRSACFHELLNRYHAVFISVHFLHQSTSLITYHQASTLLLQTTRA